MPQVLFYISLISLSQNGFQFLSILFCIISDEGDEIVECDNCGITVHEGKWDLLSHVRVFGCV